MKKNKNMIRGAYSIVLYFFVLFYPSLNGQSDINNSDLIDKYISSKGYGSPILFDYYNIKQYWVDNSVASRERSKTISIILLPDGQKGNKSIPLKIQLANVNSDDLCRVDIIGKTRDYQFYITNSISQTISSSTDEPDFIQYSAKTTSFSLEDIPDSSFYINFNSSTQDILSINKIVLSFSKNRDRHISHLNKNKLSLIKSHYLSNDETLSVTGVESEIVASQKTPVVNQLFKSSAIIKNVGNTPTRVYFGYIAYLEDGSKLNGMYYLYDKTLLKVVSHEAGSNKVVVSPYPRNWTKNCRIAKNVKEDQSDIPNKFFINNPVIDIKQIENDQGEITLQNPLNTLLPEGEEIRLHLSPCGYLYSAIKDLNPGEEAIFVSSIKKDDNNISYSLRSLPRGTFYVVPVILSFSMDSHFENTVLIRNYTFSY